MYPTDPTVTTQHGTATHDTQQTLAGALLAGALPLATLAAVAAPAAATAATLATLAALGLHRAVTRADGTDELGPPDGDRPPAGQTGPVPAGD